MSVARKCDLCGKFFESELGALCIDINVNDGSDKYQGWNDVDLCRSCSEPLLEHMADACDGLSDMVAE